jgi:hypothetical protein
MKLVMADNAPQVRKKLIVLLALALSNLFALMIAAVEVHWIFFVLAVGALIILGLAMRNVRCPRCSEPAIKRRAEALGVKWSYYGSFGIPKHCSNCGLSFVEDSHGARDRGSA